MDPKSPEALSGSDRSIPHSVPSSLKQRHFILRFRRLLEQIDGNERAVSFSQQRLLPLQEAPPQPLHCKLFVPPADRDMPTLRRSSCFRGFSQTSLAAPQRTPGDATAPSSLELLSALSAHPFQIAGAGMAGGAAGSGWGKKSRWKRCDFSSALCALQFFLN